MKKKRRNKKYKPRVCDYNGHKSKTVKKYRLGIGNVYLCKKHKKYY